MKRDGLNIIFLLAIVFAILLSISFVSAAQGDVSWAKGFGSNGTNEAGRGVAVDSSGNIYATGYFAGRTDFGQGELLSAVYPWINPATISDIFLIKYSSTGLPIWTKRIGNISDDQASDIAVDTNSNVYIVGGVGNQVEFGDGVYLTAGFYVDAFLAKYNSNGDLVWAKRFPGDRSEGAAAVDVDSSNNVVLTGAFSTFSSGVYPVSGCPALQEIHKNANGDGFLVKYNSVGSCIFAKRFGGFDGDQGMDVVTDSVGNIIVIGIFVASVDFDGNNLTGDPTTRDVFVAKYSPSGQYLWSSRIGGTGEDNGIGVAVDSSGNIYATGYFSQTISVGSQNLISNGGRDIFLIKYNSNGNVLWAKSFGNVSNDQGSGINVDKNNDVEIIGYFSNIVNFGSYSLTSPGTNIADVFVSKYDSNGNNLLAKNYGGNGNQFGYAIASDDSADLFITGSYQSTPMNFGGTILANKGASDIFLGKIVGSSAQTVPIAPTSLTATAISTTQINLQWVDNSNDETGFKIERALSSSGPGTQIATVGSNVVTYSNTGLTASTTYYYRVRANNAVGDSGYSNTASATTPANNYHPADKNTDNKINNTEIAGYNFCWKTFGCTTYGSPVSTSFNSNANFIWKSRVDGLYHYNGGTCPGCWVSG